MKATTVIAFLTAILLAGVAAWFSISGLMVIFAASGISIIIMASVLEVAKLVTASWLYRNWKFTTSLFRVYFTGAVIILMIITSLGIFGYLSKGYLDQTSSVDNHTSRVELIQGRINRLQVNQMRNIGILAQLDGAVDTLISYDRISGAGGAMALRQSQSDEREHLNAQIDEMDAEIIELTAEVHGLSSEVRALQADIGPIKYVAEWVYGDSEQGADKAVRYLILIIVIVFDPLAILLLMAAHQSQMRESGSVNTIMAEVVKTKNEIRFDAGLYSPVEEELPPRPKSIKDD